MIKNLIEKIKKLNLMVQGNLRGRNKIDMQRDMDLLKAKIKFLNSTKDFDDYVNLQESSSKLVQKFD